MIYFVYLRGMVDQDSPMGKSILNSSLMHFMPSGGIFSLNDKAMAGLKHFRFFPIPSGGITQAFSHGHVYAGGHRDIENRQEEISYAGHPDRPHAYRFGIKKVSFLWKICFIPVAGDVLIQYLRE